MTGLLLLGLLGSVQADFGGTPITFNTNGGWSFFSDPRAIIANGQLVIRSVAGTTSNGSTAGDVDVMDYNFSTQSSTETLLHSQLYQDDHADPSFAVLPDGRIMVQYQTHGATNNTLWRVSTTAGEGTAWGAEQTSDVNIANDGNGDTYANLPRVSNRFKKRPVVAPR